MPDSIRLERLRDRALMLQRSRQFFEERRVLEVDCPILSSSASVDAHIDLLKVGSNRYMHSSPEYGMKRLLSEGIGDCYQLSHVFREGERGALHNPEFMLIEWYRLGYSIEALITETLQLMALFLGELPCRTLTYLQVFKLYANLDLRSVNNGDLEEFAKAKKLPIYDGIELEGRDGWLNLIMATYLEQFLGQEELTVVNFYPASQAMLAQKTRHDEFNVAERFEVFFRGVELANGYHELANAEEQRARLVEANAERKQLGKSALPIDENFLQALEQGLPDCCGVAVGFDRLMMLRHEVDSLDAVLPFHWDNS